MGRSQETFNKKEKEKKRLKKREEKQKRKEERKANSEGGGLDSMMAYVDEFGNITDTPPDPTAKKEEIDPESISLDYRKEESDDDGIKSGRVDFYNDEKGFGFIKEKGSQNSYFFHINGAYPDIRENHQVKFELEMGPKGMQAVNVVEA